MPANQQNKRLFSAEISVPHDVVRREFPGEGIALNLTTGRYHGLNGIADAMFAALEQTGRVSDAAELLAKRFDAPRETIESDLIAFCEELLERGLIEADEPASDAAGAISRP